MSKLKETTETDMKDSGPYNNALALTPNISIFNGFGSRGSLMMLWYAEQPVHNTIPQEASITRYYHMLSGVGMERT